MNCNCLEIVRQKLESHHGEGSDVDLELKATISFSGESTEGGFGADLAPLYYTYKARKKRKRSFVTFNFCPFCGKATK